MLTNVSAIDYNTTTDFNDNFKANDGPILEDINALTQTGDRKSETSSHPDYIGEDCASALIQGYDKESSISFRRDGSRKATIYIKNDTHTVRQYIESPYFSHVIVNKDGWLMGNGGIDDGTENIKVRDYTLTMMKNNEISASYINKIFSIKKNFNVGHYIIKAPNGTYALISKYYNNVYTESGVLKKGEYIVVPNSPEYIRKGKYTDYSKSGDISEITRSLLSHNGYGVNRRNIYTYHYRNNVINSTVTLYTANDNGKYVKRNDVKCVDDVISKNRYLLAKNIPVIDNYVLVDESDFFIRKAKTNVSLENIRSDSYTVTLRAQIRDEFGNKVNDGNVNFQINNNTVKNSRGDAIPVKVKNGLAIFTLRLPAYLQKSHLTYQASYLGTSKLDGNRSEISSIIIDNIEIDTTHSYSILYDSSISIKTVAKDINNRTVNEGKIHYKINARDVINSRGNIIYINVKNGITTFNIRFSKNYQPKAYTITTIYENAYIKKEINTTFEIIKDIKKDDIRLESTHAGNIDYCKNLSITTKVNFLKDNSGINIGKLHYKINGKDIINSKKQIIFIQVKDGTGSINIHFSSQYLPRTYTITTIYEYENTVKTINTTLTIRKAA